MTEDDAPALIDSNLLVYLLDKSEPEKRKRCKQVVERVLSGGNAFVSNQVLAEVFFSLTQRIRKPINPAEAAKFAASIASMTQVQKINYTHETVKKAAFTSSSAGIHFWDALLAETMLENNVYKIYTENEKDFGKIRSIKAVNPLK